ncbi:MAG: hypothetical protein Q4D42_02360 [Eubacteriales bacterium]|nr:hypothetical protein [Eubacteriales bacterium]
MYLAFAIHAGCISETELFRTNLHKTIGQNVSAIRVVMQTAPSPHDHLEQTTYLKYQRNVKPDRYIPLIFYQTSINMQNILHVRKTVCIDAKKFAVSVWGIVCCLHCLQTEGMGQFGKKTQIRMRMIGEYYKKTIDFVEFIKRNDQVARKLLLSW